MAESYDYWTREAERQAEAKKLAAAKEWADKQARKGGKR